MEIQNSEVMQSTLEDDSISQQQCKVRRCSSPVFSAAAITTRTFGKRITQNCCTSRTFFLLHTQVCSVMLDSIDSLKSHLKQHIVEKSFQCKICNLTVEKKEYLDIHMEYVHQVGRKVGIAYMNCIRSYCKHVRI